jgi:hypothetical protein
MKHILFISSLFITLNCSAQSYIIGMDFNTFHTHNYNFTRVDTYSASTGSMVNTQRHRTIVPIIGFSWIDKKSRIYNVELGYGKHTNDGTSKSIDNSSGNIYKTTSKENSKNYVCNFQFGQLTNLNKFKVITTVGLPFSYFPKATQESFDTTIRPSSNPIQSTRISTSTEPNHITTGLRLKAEANYPVYKKLYVAVKLNFGIDYDVYFGKSIDKSEAINGTTSQKQYSEYNYKDRFGFQKHFSPSVGFNYFL